MILLSIRTGPLSLRDGNIIIVARREHVAFPGNVSATCVLALKRQGTQRWYLGRRLPGAVLNLARPAAEHSASYTSLAAGK